MAAINFQFFSFVYISIMIMMNLQDILEAPTSLSNESTFNWYDEQMMVSTVAEHGFCFYAKHLSDMGLKSSCDNCVDLTSEMLASTTDIMALGYLSRQGLSNPCTGKDLENKSRNDLPDRYLFLLQYYI